MQVAHKPNPSCTNDSKLAVEPHYNRTRDNGYRQLEAMYICHVTLHKPGLII